MPIPNPVGSNPVYLALCLSVFAGSSVSAQTCPSDSPIWADEFNGDTLNTSKWEIMLGDGCDYGICNWGNNELQYYQAGNIAVKNGIMAIHAKRQNAGGKQYTSARIRSTAPEKGGSWTTGRFEARIKIPTGAGMWPAFWMLPTSAKTGWPMSGEIDIMEAVGQEDEKVLGTIHYGESWPNNSWTGGEIHKETGAWSDDFHVYAVEWEKGEIRWYLDGALYSTKTAANMENPGHWRFEENRFHILLNVAVGGNLGGKVDDSMLPQSMQVDYVRVYELGPCAKTR